jgi:hypothetical protein
MMHSILLWLPALKRHVLYMSSYVSKDSTQDLLAHETNIHSETKNVTNKGCGVPDRNKGDKFVAIGVSGAVVAVVAFILRMSASIGKKGRQVSWDDATMGVVVLLAIPPAVFAPYRRSYSKYLKQFSSLTMFQW